MLKAASLMGERKHGEVWSTASSPREVASMDSLVKPSMLATPVWKAAGKPSMVCSTWLTRRATVMSHGSIFRDAPWAREGRKA